MVPCAVAISRNPLKSSRRLATLPSQKCQLTPFHEEQSSMDIEMEFLLATSPDNAETMGQFLIGEIGNHMFDCLSAEGSYDESELYRGRKQQQEQQRNNLPREDWSRRAREIGILSLTVVSVSPGMCNSMKRKRVRQCFSYVLDIICRNLPS